VLDLAERKVAVVLPPTIVMLRRLLAAGFVAEVLRLAPRRPLAPVYPRVGRTTTEHCQSWAEGKSVLRAGRRLN
jgi:hypothetical protein